MDAAFFSGGFIFGQDGSFKKELDSLNKICSKDAAGQDFIFSIINRNMRHKFR